MKILAVGSSVFLALALLVAGGCYGATLVPASQRKLAQEFRLFNTSGETVSSASYRGRVLLLNFWATECGGCRAEIPYFMEFDQTYKSSGLAVVGISMDIMYEGLKDASEGWSRVKPFVREHKINYSILMGDQPVSKLYNVEAMPATYLIDKRGRVAASYVGVVVKKDEVVSQIKTLLRE